MFLSVPLQVQTKEIREKQTSVVAELAKVEPAVRDAKTGQLFWIVFVHKNSNLKQKWSTLFWIVFVHKNSSYLKQKWSTHTMTFICSSNPLHMNLLLFPTHTWYYHILHYDIHMFI